MNSLLARQIRKHLGNDYKNDAKTLSFLDVIDKSYENYEDQFSMLQRAMSISSKELFDANDKLKKEAQRQQKVIASLEDATKTLRAVTISNDKGKKETKELTGIELAKLIEEQAFQISQIEKQREKILTDLEKSNQELSEYAHVVSHDLKSPLRTINTLINWIFADTPDDLNQTTKEHLNLIDKNIQKMDNLIEGILEYSIIDKKVNHKIELDTHSLVEEIIFLQSNPDTISFSILNPLPVIQADVLKLKQVFQNLITNAVSSINKDQGKIQIASEEMDDFWKFSVSDNGIGIDKKYHEKVFQIFQTLDQKKESTGIGLSIVKKIIDSYKGKIWIESEIGKGTTFFFTIKK